MKRKLRSLCLNWLLDPYPGETLAIEDLCHGGEGIMV